MIRLAAASRVVRVVTLAAQARQMLPGDEIELHWPLALGMPWQRRISAVLHEAQLSTDTEAPGAFTDETLARDATRAGLALVRRDGDVITLRRESRRTPATRARLTLADAAHCVALVLRAELLVRRHASPTDLVERARRLGARSTSTYGRAELRADLALLEPLVPGHRGCLRRVIAELAGDAEAAREPVVLGLTPHSTGHASFGHTTPWAPEHPVAFALAAPGAARLDAPLSSK